MKYNDSHFPNWDTIAAATGGQWLRPPRGNAPTAILDDSRKIIPGCLFCAISGELADGHAYIANAAAAGAGAVSAERIPSPEVMEILEKHDCGLLLVNNGLRAFQAVAAANRMQFCIPIVAVTGSCGKTSTKEMCAAVLSVKYGDNLVKTEGNTNNHFGVPRNLLRINPDTPAAVIEAGSNHPGEIQALAELIRPHISIVCSIASAHLEFFHDLNGVAEEKGDLFQATEEDGIVIMPSSCAGKEILQAHAGNRKIITFGLDEAADVQARYLGWSQNAFTVELIHRATGEKSSFTWNIGGECQASNAAAAAAAGIALGMTLDEIAAGLQRTTLPGARMSQSDINGIHWVNDAYNANPDSMAAGLKWFKEISTNAPRRTLLLGDMRELGTAAEPAHAAILKKAMLMFPNDDIATVGPLFAPVSHSMNIRNYPDVEAAKAHAIAEGTWIFLKASYGTGLYKLVPVVK